MVFSPNPLKRRIKILTGAMSEVLFSPLIRLLYGQKENQGFVYEASLKQSDLSPVGEAAFLNYLTYRLSLNSGTPAPTAPGP